MIALRVVISVFVGLIAITLIAESVEFVTVKIVSGKNFSDLTSNQSGYFEVRNTHGILLFKILYSFLAGIVGGYLAARISLGRPLLAILLLIGIQVLSLIWAGFFSELSKTGPFWMWVYLILLIPLGIFIGYKMRVKKKSDLPNN